MPGGAPTKYKPEYCQQIIDYYAEFEMFDEVPVDKQDKDGNVTTTMKQIPARPPSFVKFGLKIGVVYDTLQEWTKVHPEFSVAYKNAKKIYEDVMRDGAMTGLYKENFTKMVMAHNFNWSDKTETKNENTYPQGIEVQFIKSKEPAPDDNSNT